MEDNWLVLVNKFSINPIFFQGLQESRDFLQLGSVLAISSCTRSSKLASDLPLASELTSLNCTINLLVETVSLSAPWTAGASLIDAESEMATSDPNIRHSAHKKNRIVD